MSADRPITMSGAPSDSSGLGAIYGLAAIALVAMGLLTYGYNRNKGVEVAQAPASTTTPATTTTGTAPGFKSPDTPKAYQPATPAPDNRDAPTSSSAGQGADNGGRPKNMTK